MISEIFKAYDIRSTYPDKLNEDAAWRVGCATGRFLKQGVDPSGGENAKSIAVSRDMRPHSPGLAAALIEGIRASGMDVIDLGMCDTSMIYFAVNHLKCAGGVQTTASHNPVEYNGFKISGREARPIGGMTGLKEIESMAESMAGPGSEKGTGGLESRDLWAEYREHVLQFYTFGGRKLKVYIDASNGMAGKMVPALFDGVEGIEIIPLNFEITGSFVHEPNPLVPENMKPTQDGVVEHGADLGACFDGDADRCMLTDEKGEIIGCDHLTALLAGYFLDQSPGSTIVYDLRSSKSVEQAIREHGGTPHRGRVGHVFMKAALRETGGVFGGELSGHFYYRDNFYTDSGAITFAAVASILSASDKTISGLIDPYRKYPQSGEINFRVENKDVVLESIRERGRRASGRIDELDGVSVDAWDNEGYWFNVRPSNTEPLLRLNAEAKDTGLLDGLMSELGPELGEPVAGH